MEPLLPISSFKASMGTFTLPIPPATKSDSSSSEVTTSTTTEFRPRTRNRPRWCWGSTARYTLSKPVVIRSLSSDISRCSFELAGAKLGELEEPGVAAADQKVAPANAKQMHGGVLRQHRGFDDRDVSVYAVRKEPDAFEPARYGVKRRQHQSENQQL